MTNDQWETAICRSFGHWDLVIGHFPEVIGHFLQRP
jgi:hypothetical protein